MNIDNTYIVNPAYKLRSDLKRVIITNNNSLLYGFDELYGKKTNVQSSFSWILHPDLAYIFSEFDGSKTLREIINDLSKEFDLPEEDMLNTIANFIDNEETVMIPVPDSYAFYVPQNFLIRKEDGMKPKLLSKDEIAKIANEELDFHSYRHHIPNEMSIMINNKCVVDCEYCYADKSINVPNSLPFQRVKELIKEASELGLRDVAIGGGEFFLYPNWRELIDELHKYEYAPYISTKHPLDEEMVNTLKNKGIKTIQLSIDTVDNSEIRKILNVGENYLEKVMKGVQLLNDAGIEMIVKPVITKYNDSIQSVSNLLHWLSNFPMVIHVNIAPGAYSIYKEFNYSTTVEKIKKIDNFIKESKAKFHFPILVQGYEYEFTLETKLETFPRRSLCSGNATSFYILPDGKVTICEQMYWQPFFILGNVSTHSIMEVWNSKKALALWNYSQEEVREESPCKQCDEFDNCRRGLGNCWRIAIAAYGVENYDYPAPNCPKSLPITRPYYMPEK